MRAKIGKILCLAVFCALFLPGVARAQVAVGDNAPALTATTLDGKTFDLSALKGKVVIINFWATWCPACHEEMPALEAVWRQYRGQGLQVLAISCDLPRTRGDVGQVMNYFSFPAAMFGDLTKNGFGTPQSIPVTYVIDKQGVVRDILSPDVTPVTESGLGDIVKDLLAAKDAEKPDAKKTDDKPAAAPAAKTEDAR